VLFLFGRRSLQRKIGFGRGCMRAISQAERGPIGTGRNINVDPRLLRCRLIKLGEAFSDFCNPEPHNRVFAGLVVGSSTEYLRTDYALAKEVILPGECVLDDVPEQGLTLLRITKRRAGQNLI